MTPVSAIKADESSKLQTPKQAITKRPRRSPTPSEPATSFQSSPESPLIQLFTARSDRNSQRNPNDKDVCTSDNSRNLKRLRKIHPDSTPTQMHDDEDSSTVQSHIPSGSIGFLKEPCTPEPQHINKKFFPIGVAPHSVSDIGNTEM